MNYRSGQFILCTNSGKVRLGDAIFLSFLLKSFDMESIFYHWCLGKDKVLLLMRLNI